MALQQYHIGSTYYGFDPNTGETIAFANEAQLKQYFPGGFVKNAPTLPSNALVDKANAAPGQVVNPFNNSTSKTPATTNTSTPAPTQSTPPPTTTNNPPPVGGLQMPAGYPASNPPANSNSSSGTTNIAAQPASVNFINSAAYKSLTPDQQAMINTMYNVYATGTAQQQNLLISAVTAAKANSDPYYKSLFDITMGEFGAKVAAENNDFGSQSAIIKQTQQNLLANVNAQEGALTLENQADLSKIAINYNNDLLNTQAGAADKGVVEGSGYGTLNYQTGVLTAQKENTVMSTEAAYNYNIQALQLKASQGDTMAQLQLDQLTKSHAANIQNLGTSAESTLGTAAVNDVPGLTSSGYTALGGNNGGSANNGGFVGTLNEQKQTDVLTGIKNYLGLAQPSVSATGA